jgi:hypothetical protein
MEKDYQVKFFRQGFWPNGKVRKNRFQAQYWTGLRWINIQAPKDSDVAARVDCAVFSNWRLKADEVEVVAR